MKKSIVFILLAFASLVSISFIASCTKEEAKTDKETTEQPQIVDNYYVK